MAADDRIAVAPLRRRTGPWWLILLGGLARQAAEAAEADRARAALLAAVSHDLRAPLAAAKAAVSGLRSRDDLLAADDREELLATAEESVPSPAAPGGCWPWPPAAGTSEQPQ